MDNSIYIILIIAIAVIALIMMERDKTVPQLWREKEKRQKWE